MYLLENLKAPEQTPREMGRLLCVSGCLGSHRKSQGRESCLHFIFAAQAERNVQAAFMFLWAQWGMSQAACLTVHTIDLGGLPPITDSEEAAVSHKRAV